MLNEILGLVKDQAMGAVGNAGVPADKKDAAVSTTTEAIVDGLKSNLSLDNLSSLTGLFSGGSGAANNSVVNSVQDNVISSLSQKVGLSKETAGSIASAVVPAIMGLLSKKSDDSNDSFSFESLIKSFTGGDAGQSGGGIMGMIGKLFGK